MVEEYGLNADGFSFATWNIHKGAAEGWSQDFQKLCGSTDILVLQEVLLTDNLIQMLRQENYQWDLAAAYTYQNVEAGVLTASKILPSLACTLKDKEPIIRVPKSILITRHPISGTDRELLVANIHAINFTLGHSAFQKQWDRLENMLAGHEGPMIVSGDFITWTSGRMSRVNAMAKRLALSAVVFNKNLKSKFLGKSVDHVFYRGLEKKDAAISLVTTSDHNPLSVVFRLAND
jgi:endonuclease/exonuclease/phosphatase (EEP) superfamily protein YafD